MTTQEKLSFYGSSAFSKSRIPPLAPAKEAYTGIMDQPLAWGHYAGLDSAVEVEHQLEAALHTTYERQEREGRRTQIFCDAQRWNFENVGRVHYFLFILKLLCFFFVPAIFITDIATILDSLIIAFVCYLHLRKRCIIWKKKALCLFIDGPMCYC